MNMEEPVAGSPGWEPECVARLLGDWSPQHRTGPMSLVHGHSGESPVGGREDLGKPSACAVMGSVGWMFPSVLKAETKTALLHDAVKF